MRETVSATCVPAGLLLKTAAGPERPSRAIMGGKSSLHSCAFFAFIGLQTGSKCPDGYPSSASVFGWIYYLPLQGKGNISPAREVSESDGIFWSRDVYHKAKESGR